MLKTLPLADEELVAWLRLAATPGVGPVTAHRLLAAFGLPQQIFSLSRSILAQKVGAELATALKRAPDHTFDRLAIRTREWLAAPGNHFVTLSDPAYPSALLNGSAGSAPPVLYVKGRLELLHADAIAIVGSRNATAQGNANAEAFAQALGETGLTVVSGLALGIDGAAHRGALHTRGGTVAVIATGADIVYPAQHHALAHQIAEAGAIVSELPLGTPARPGHFPQRNRLLAGLAKGVLVVEAAARSGSLITARLAGELGRDVFALPGSIHAPLAKGCHRLIKEGAKLVESAEDVLAELVAPVSAPHLSSPVRKPHTIANDRAAATVSETSGGAEAASVTSAPASAAATAVLAALGHDPAPLDVLAARTGLTGAALQAALLKLELTGAIELLPGSRVAPLKALPLCGRGEKSISRQLKSCSNACIKSR